MGHLVTVLALAGGNPDPVSGFFTQWDTRAQSWMPHILVIAAVLGFILYTIGHHRGWAHMREALAGGLFVMLVIALAPTLF